MLNKKARGTPAMNGFVLREIIYIQGFSAKVINQIFPISVNQQDDAWENFEPRLILQ
jgi:hypothetical protein